MYKLEVKKGEQWWELDTNEVPVSLNYRQDDIKDITKKKNSFTKSIILPGTERNIQFFNYATEINTDLTNFNVKKGFPAKLYSEDRLVFEGDLILTKIDKTGEYKNGIHTTITTPLKSIEDELDGIFINDLLGDFCHTRTRETQIASWTAPPGEGYVYPYIIKGDNDDHFGWTYYFDLDPAVYVKTIIDSIFRELDNDYVSRFFNSEYFKRLIIPGAVSITEDDEVLLEKTTVVGTNNTTPIMAKFLVNSWVYTDSWLQFNPFQAPYYLPLERTTGTVTDDGEDLTFTDELAQWNNSSNTMTISKSGYYDINLTLNYFFKYEPVRDAAVTFNYTNRGEIEWRWQLQRKSGSTWQNIATSNDYGGQGQYGILTVQPSNDNTQPASGFLDTGSPLLVDVVLNEFWLNENDELRFRIGFKTNFKQGGINSSWRVQPLLVADQVSTQLHLVPDFDGRVSKFSIEPSSPKGWGDEEVCLGRVLPRITAFDFLINISKMFNLVIVKKDNTYFIEPINEWFDSKQNVKDWNHKIDMELYDIQPMSEVNFNEWKFTYTEDDDWLNKLYQDEYEAIYGEKVIKLENIYSNNKGELKVIFSPTPITDKDLSNGKVAPHFLTEEGTPKNVKTRILFYGGLKEGQFVLRDKKEDFTDLTFNEYPYCGMWDDPYNPEWDLSFGIVNRTYYETDVRPLNNLFNTFHKKTFESIVDNNAKLLTGYFDLNAFDISDFDFRDVIFLFGEYWRVNGIFDYDPGNPKLTKVELYKIIDWKVYNPSVVEGGDSQNACPSDISIQNRTYVSKSGQPISRECCVSLGGFWNGTTCALWTISDDEVLDPSVGNPGFEAPILVAPRIPDWTFKRPVINVWRRPGVTTGVSIGKGNIITRPNTIAIGDGIKTNESGVIYIGGTRITEFGVNKDWKTIRSGVDVVRPIYSVNPEVVSIYSGKDEVRRLCYSAPYEIINPNLGFESPYQSVPDWILQTGFWNDNGEWVDTSTWND